MNMWAKEVERHLEEKNIDSAKQCLIESLSSAVIEYRENASSQSASYFAHYTSVETIFSIIEKYGKGYKNNESAGLRAYDTFYLNDPDEGKLFQARFVKSHKWLQEVEQNTNAFICSFAAGDEKVGDVLQHWKSYGESGRGCSIQIPFSCIVSAQPILYGETNIDDAENYFCLYLNSGQSVYAALENEDDKKIFATQFWKEFDSIQFLYLSLIHI